MQVGQYNQVPILPTKSVGTEFSRSTGSCFRFMLPIRIGCATNRRLANPYCLQSTITRGTVYGSSAGNTAWAFRLVRGALHHRGFFCREPEPACGENQFRTGTASWGPDDIEPSGFRR